MRRGHIEGSDEVVLILTPKEAAILGDFIMNKPWREATDSSVPHHAYDILQPGLERKHTSGHGGHFEGGAVALYASSPGSPVEEELEVVWT